MENCNPGINDYCVPVDEDPENRPDDEARVPPPTVSECQDHDYARPSSPPSSAMSTDKSSARHARGKKTTNGRKGKKALEAPAPMQFHQSTQCTRLFLDAVRLSEHHRKQHKESQTYGEFFRGITRLREHELTVHGVLPFKCDYCDMRFKLKPRCHDHMRSRHTGEKAFHCDVCGKGCTSVRSLKEHRITHFDRTFTCEVCGKSFHRANHLREHKQVHEEVKAYQCATCGKGFTQVTHLKAHRTAHTDEKQRCTLCGKSYTTRDSLKTHMVIKHSHELPPDELPVGLISCEVCGKTFPNRSTYKIHKMIHTGERPFSCDACGKRFRTKQILIVHKYVHAGEKPAVTVVCDLCGQTYPSKEKLKQHKYTHTGEKPHKCSVCDKTFPYATYLKRHQSMHTAETPYSCKECGKHFRLLTYLQAHEQTLAHKRRTSSSDMASSENTDSSRPKKKEKL